MRHLARAAAFAAALLAVLATSPPTDEAQPVATTFSDFVSQPAAPAAEMAELSVYLALPGYDLALVGVDAVAEPASFAPVLASGEGWHVGESKRLRGRQDGRTALAPPPITERGDRLSG